MVSNDGDDPSRYVRRQARLTVGGFLASLVFAFCGETPGNAGAVTVRRDSGGITIAESQQPIWTAASQWSIDPKPFLSLGVTSGDTAQMFSGIVRALRLENGSIVVLDGDSRQLRLFDSAGVLIRVAGHRGNGPGEFGILEGFERCGNELWVQDFSRRVSAWNHQLAFQWEFRPKQMPMWPFMCVGGTGVIVKDDAGFEWMKEPINTVYEDSLRLFLAVTDSAASREFLRIPLWHYITIVTRNNPNFRLGVRPPFGLNSVLAVRAAGLLLSGREAFEIPRICHGRPASAHCTRTVRGFVRYSAAGR
jgi:hypothetical protein